MNDQYTPLAQTIIRRCDKAMIGCFYAFIFLIPIAPALIEWSFGLALLFHLVKRSTIYSQELKASSQLTFVNRIKLFLKCFTPVSTPCNKYVGWFAAAVFLSVVFSQYHDLSVEAYVFKFLQSIYFFFLSVEALSSRKRLNIFFLIFFISMSFINLNGIYQYFMRQGFIHFHVITDGRVSSSFNHPNDFAAYLVIILPMLLSLSIISFAESRKQNQEKSGSKLDQFYRSNSFRIWTGLLFLSGLVCIGLTFSRGAWLGMIGALLYFGARKPKYLFWLLSCIVFFLMIYFPKMALERTTNIDHKGFVFTISDRGIYWSDALNIYKKNLVVGTGFNSYAQAGKDYGNKFDMFPHNGYLRIAAETGTLGLATFLLILISLFRNAKKYLREMTDSHYSYLMWGLIAGYFGFLIHGFFDTQFHSFKLNSLMWVIFGVLMAIPKVILPSRSGSGSN